ncbi:MAG: rhomboid family intramembrane serine protease [Pseudomonadota bacterium]
MTDVSTANAYYFGFGFVPAVVNDLVDLPPELLAVPEPASYITYAFLHGDFMHLAGNMLFLWVFGDNVEDAMGHFRYLIFYLLCAVAGALAHNLVEPSSEAPLIGASGAIAGLVGAYLMLHPRVKVWILAFGRIPLRLSAFWVLGAWIAYQLFYFLFDTESEVSWAAHIGGILAGVFLIPIFKRKEIALFDRNLPIHPPSVPTVGVEKKSDEPIATSKEKPKQSGSPTFWGRGE